MKKILFVYPHNFLNKDMGTNMRVYSLAKELSSQDYNIDLYAISNFCSSFEHLDSINNEQIVRNLYLYDYNNTVKYNRKKREEERAFFERLKRWVLKTFFSIHQKNIELESWVTPSMVSQFNNIVFSNNYDYIVMFYVYSAELLSPENYKGDAKKVYFMEDTLSVVRYISKETQIGHLLDDEINRMSYFDKIACISYDEKTFFEKLIAKQFYFFPHLIHPHKNRPISKNKVKRVVFVGFDNPFNIEGMDWFFSLVYEHLSQSVEILVVGKVSNSIKSCNSNVRLIGFVEDLDELYQNTDIVICPLQNGTGMKIKVIEAMSYGIPIVCTSRGVDGFMDKSKSGCIVENTPKGFAEAINLLVLDEEYYSECSQRVLTYFSTALSWDNHKDTIKEIFE